MIQGKMSTVHQRMHSVQLYGNTSVATGMDLLEINRKEVSEVNKDDGFIGEKKEKTRGEVIEWIYQGGGLTIDSHVNQKAHFTIECHGVKPRSVDSTHTIYVSSHWIRSCLEDGCLLEVNSHILYSPLPCQTPLPGFEHFRFSVSQYEEKDRLLLRNLCFTLGAKFLEKLNKKVTHLLCKFTIGSKYDAACKWGIHRITCDWIYECVKQNKVIALDQYYPREVTAEDQEAGLCAASQFPTQDVQIVSVSNPSQYPSQSQDCSFSRPEAIDRRKENIREETKDTSRGKKAKTLGEVPQSVPDVASAIEDLLEQTTKVHMKEKFGICNKWRTICAAKEDMMMLVY